MTKINDNKVPNVPNLRFSNDIWNSYKFGSLFDVSNGINKDKKYFGFGTPIINYMDVNKNLFINPNEINGKVAATKYDIETYKINTDDLIITRTSETVDEIAYASCIMEEIKDCVFSGFLLRARPKSNLTNTKFVTLLFHSKTYREKLIKIATVTSRALINTQNLKELTISLPSICTQEKIATFLIKIEDRIILQNKIIEEIKTFKNGLYFKFFNNSHGNTLSYYADVFNGYPFDSETYDVNGKFKIVTISNVTGNYYVNSSNSKKTTILPKNISSEQILNIGDIVISMTGNVGRVSIVNEKNCLLNQRVAVLKLKDKNNFNYIFHSLSSGRFEYIMRMLGQGAAQANISKKNIEDYKLPDEIDNKVIHLIDYLSKKEMLEQTILEKLLLFKKYFLENLFI